MMMFSFVNEWFDCFFLLQYKFVANKFCPSIIPPEFFKSSSIDQFSN